MKEMTLRDVQTISLDILKHFHRFCRDNNIRYSLGYGTLIGAIRHKGFIPWDDDIDVVMLRDDFERFCQVYKDTSDFKLFAPSRNNIYAACARLCDMQHTVVKTTSPMFNEQTGVWIDIFPVDFVDDTRDRNYWLKIREIKSVHIKTLECRQACNPFSKSVSGLGTFLKWIMLKRKFRGVHLEMLAKQHDKLCKEFTSSVTNTVCLLAYPIYVEWDYVPKSVFSKIIEISFEDYLFDAVADYDIFLRILYGDYMQLPSKEQQTRGHVFHKYYWK